VKKVILLLAVLLFLSVLLNLKLYFLSAIDPLGELRNVWAESQIGSFSENFIKPDVRYIVGIILINFLATIIAIRYLVKSVNKANFSSKDLLFLVFSLFANLLGSAAIAFFNTSFSF
jgi:hypothetical protein